MFGCSSIFGHILFNFSRFRISIKDSNMYIWGAEQEVMSREQSLQLSDVPQREMVTGLMMCWQLQIMMLVGFNDITIIFGYPYYSNHLDCPNLQCWKISIPNIIQLKARESKMKPQFNIPIKIFVDLSHLKNLLLILII